MNRQQSMGQPTAESGRDAYDGPDNAINTKNDEKNHPEDGATDFGDGFQSLWV